IALKLSDLGHLAEELHVHSRWVSALEEELYRQGDREKAAGLPISPLFDRTKPGVSKSQARRLEGEEGGRGGGGGGRERRGKGREEGREYFLPCCVVLCNVSWHVLRSCVLCVWCCGKSSDAETSYWRDLPSLTLPYPPFLTLPYPPFLTLPYPPFLTLPYPPSLALPYPPLTAHWYGAAWWCRSASWTLWWSPCSTALSAPSPAPSPCSTSWP
ncbi:hypothetical protein V8C86DRAFT_1797512, partial [Haematococcus lacustris]